MVAIVPKDDKDACPEFHPEEEPGSHTNADSDRQNEKGCLLIFGIV